MRAYAHTFGLPVLLTNCSNNYGPRQFPEKLIPLVTLNAVEGRPVPIYGSGTNVRDWLHVEDHCEGLLLVLRTGQTGHKYNLGGDTERTNLEVVDRVCAALEELRPAASNPALRAATSYDRLRTFVPDRPGHDQRYAIDSGKLRTETGWSPQYQDIRAGLTQTIDWYRDHESWWAPMRERSERTYQRLGR